LIEAAGYNVGTFTSALRVFSILHQGHRDAPTREPFGRAGGAAHLSKPFDEQALLDSIARDGQR
jgi:hypothetical protein